MKKHIICLVAIAVLLSAVTVYADSAFNDMSKWVQGWGKACGACAKTAPCAPCKAANAPCCKKVDALGNKVSTVTNNSGQTALGR